MSKRPHRRGPTTPDLPPVVVVDVVRIDDDGPVAEVAAAGHAPRGRRDKKKPTPPAVLHITDAQGKLGVGDRALVRVLAAKGARQSAALIKVLPKPSTHVVGIVHKGKGSTRLIPADKKAKRDFALSSEDAKTLEHNDVVIATLGVEDRYGLTQVKVTEVIGRADDPRVASLIAIATHGIPIGFTDAVIAEANQAAERKPGGDDLRHLPLLTIDPADARDHDDAVCAIADDDPKNPGGWVIWSAIADVARYVHPGSALDRAAYDKGVSVYFPDRVEPMLPEVLSNGACSLKPDVDRACIAVRMVFDAHGKKRSHKFHRGIMRSRAKLSYEQAQDAFNNEPDAQCAPLMADILKPLWAAYQALVIARDKRAPLSIDSTERKIRFDPSGKIASITPKIQLEAHKLIEEIMIQSNVCAAESLEKARTPLIYRIHDMPSGEKLLALSEVLRTFDLDWNLKEPATPKRFNTLKSLVADGTLAGMLNEVILRSQSQAVYSHQNIGHFGLNLTHYAHFTSPIRRYADLIVHRALIKAFKLGDDGLTDREAGDLEAIAQQITTCERRAVAAEREANDRYLAAYLADHVGASFTGTISGATRWGLFVRLDNLGADGIVPSSRLPRGFEFYEGLHAVLNRHGHGYRLGDAVTVELIEATPVTGGLMFEITSDPPTTMKPPRGRPQANRRPEYRKHARRR